MQRLKDKVGNRSNASSEVEFHGALAAQPLLAAVLAYVCLESEAATALALRLARAFDAAAADPAEYRFARVATAVAK